MDDAVPEITDPTESFLQQNLPFCIENMDVSNYAYVEPMTLEQASALVFNLASVEITEDILKLQVVLIPAEAVYPDGSEAEETTYELIFTDVAYPDGEEGWGVEPFKLSTIHSEERGDDYFQYLRYSEEEVEPRQRAACGPAESSREIHSFTYPGDVFASVNFGPFVKMYDGDVDDEANHIGYGFPIGALQMHSGVEGVDANGVAYGNFAEDGDWESDGGLFPYPNWWAEFGPFYGNRRERQAQPDNVTTVSIDGFPFVAAYWQGRDADFFAGERTQTTWTATGLPPSGSFNFYNYESQQP